MNARFESWQELYDSYHMKFKLPRLSQDRTIRMSRLYPLVRQLQAGATFRNPYIFVNAKPFVEQGERDLRMASRKLEVAANEGLELMKANVTIRQAFFNAQFTGLGVIRLGVVPADGPPDLGYGVESTMLRDFMYLSCRESFNFGLDPMTSPEGLWTARYTCERMLQQKRSILKDERYSKFRSRISELSGVTQGSSLNTYLPLEDEREALRKSLENGKFMEVWEIQDNAEQKVYHFIDGIDEPIYEDDHPFMEMISVEAKDPVTGVSRILDYIAPPNGDRRSILPDGVSYILLRVDTDSGFFPTPPLSRVVDLEKIVVESQSRRLDLMRRYTRNLIVERREIEANSKLPEEFENLEDGDFLVLDDKNSIGDLKWDAIPDDQLALERDAIGYEEQSLHISDMSAGDARTATASSLMGAQTSLNRDWIQDRVGEVYKTIVSSMFRIFRDPRFTPENFLANLQPDDVEGSYQVLTQDDFLFEYSVSIDTASMQPMIEQMARDDVILLYDRLKQSPNVDLLELDKMLIKSSRIRNTERVLKGRAQADAERLAQIENMVYLVRGADPGYADGMQDAVHIQTHDPSVISKLPEFQQLQPAMQQQVLQIVQKHIEGHQQRMQTAMSGGGGGSQPNVDGRLTQGMSNLTKTVKGNAQRTANAASADVARLTGQAG